jgi:hypothetical protein
MEAYTCMALWGTVVCRKEVFGPHLLGQEWKLGFNV